MPTTNQVTQSSWSQEGRWWGGPCAQGDARLPGNAKACLKGGRHRATRDGHVTSLGPAVPGGAAGGQRDSTALREVCSHCGIQALQEQPTGARFSKGPPRVPGRRAAVPASGPHGRLEPGELSPPQGSHMPQTRSDWVFLCSFSAASGQGAGRCPPPGTLGSLGV